MNHLAIVDLLRYFNSLPTSDNRNEYKVLSSVDKADEEVSNLFLPGQTINCIYGNFSLSYILRCRMEIQE
jgi:hypothetical protein